MSQARWFCVAIGSDSVKGPFSDIGSAKQELNKNTGSATNRQMICEMTKNGAKSDPHTVGGQNQGGGAASGFQKWWGGWGDIHRMNLMCNGDSACKNNEAS